MLVIGSAESAAPLTAIERATLLSPRLVTVRLSPMLAPLTLWLTESASAASAA